MGRKAVNKVPAFVDVLVEVGIRRLTQAMPTNAEEAGHAMQDIAAHVCRIYAKTVLYIPANAEPQRAQRDELIRQQYAQDGAFGARKFTAERAHELASEFELSVGQLYCILRPPKSGRAPNTGSGSGSGSVGPASPSPMASWPPAQKPALVTADDSH